MEITARMKDDLIRWMGIHEKSLKNQYLVIDDLPAEIHCLGFVTGVMDKLHVTDVRTIAMILGLDDNVKCAYIGEPDDGYEYDYEYRLKVGDITYYSLHKEELK